MRFDPLSYSLGLATGAGLSLAVWRYRARLATLRESAEEQVEGTRRFIGRTAEARYANDLRRYAQRRHIASALCDLTDVLLEPRLLIAPQPHVVLPGTEDAPDRDVFDVVPRWHDMPASYTPYNIETLSLEDLGYGDRQIAILGASGMGKSTALSTLALIALGDAQFETMEEVSQQAIAEEEKGLTKEERLLRAKERQQIQARALDKLHEVQERRRQQLAHLERSEDVPPLDIRTLMPVLVHLNDVDFDIPGYTKSATPDPAELLVRAAQRRMSVVTQQVVGSVIYPALERGQALVLLDGYDELAPAARDAYFYWLQQFVAMYGHNMMVITGPPVGYEQLLTLGFTPTFLRAWREEDYVQLADHWTAVWAAQSRGRRKTSLPDDQVLRRVKIDNRGRNILDVTLKIWTGLADDAQQTGRSGWYDAWINRQLSNADYRALLPSVGVQLVEAERPVRRAELERALAEAMPQSEDGKAPKVEGILDALVKDGLLLSHPGDMFSFPHPSIASYAASESIVQAGTEQATELALEPHWQDALAFAAAHINMTAAVYRKLGVPPDLMYSNLFGLVPWLLDAPADAPWRGDVFKRLAAALMAPEQFPAVRERAMAALIASRDKNVLFILRQALRSVSADVRRLACIGLGALGDAEATKDVAPMLSDDDHDVQLAAGLALGAIGTDRALEIMVHGLVDGTDELRQAVAVTLAAIPGEGHAVLRDGVQSEDIMIRRATVYGLSRVKAPWALTSLYRAMTEDEQWYVRTAAEEAFMAAQSPERRGPRAHPEADSLVWLVQWAAERGEGVPAGPNARQVLVRVLQEGHPVQKHIAAITLARLAHVSALKPLYNTLRDRDPGVRSTAYNALAELQMCLGQPLPSLA